MFFLLTDKKKGKKKKRFNMVLMNHVKCSQYRLLRDLMKGVLVLCNFLPFLLKLKFYEIILGRSSLISVPMSCNLTVLHPPITMG